MITPSKMEVNAAIEELIGGIDNWTEPASVILDFIKFMPTSIVEASASIRRSNSTGSSFSGLTESGENIQLSAGDDKAKTFRRTLAGHRERVGHYKLRRGSKTLMIQHWWKADEETTIEEESAAEMYAIVHKDDFSPICFGKMVNTKPLKILFITFHFKKFIPIYGICPFPVFGINIDIGW